jgi:regulator of sigma E protease
MDTLINIALLLVILVGLVLVHELGHFITAKRAGVKVHEFGVGFPPRAAVLFRRGETIYTLNWLPIGGFIRLEGEEGESVDPRAFVNQKLGTRLRILLAGVVVNFVLAWLIFTLIALTAQPTLKTRIGGVMADSPAAAAALSGGNVVRHREVVVEGEVIEVPVYDGTGDLIVAIDGKQFPVFDDLAKATDPEWRGAPIEFLAARAAQEVVLTIEDNEGTLEEVTVTLRTQEEIDDKLGALGFTQDTPAFGSQSNGLVESIAIGLDRTLETSTLILRGIGSLIVSIFEGPSEDSQVAGPVGIVSVIGTVRAELPPVFMIYFIALLSANLAVINALPFPPMDGGRITMALIQTVSRGAVSPAAERAVYLTGFVLLMMLLVWVTIGDISRLAS